MSRQEERLIQILEYLSKNSPATIARIMEALEIPRASVFRLIRLLSETGYIRKSADGRGYVLGLQLFALSRGVIRNMEIIKAAHPALRWLLKKTGCTAELAIPFDKHRLIYIDKSESAEDVMIYAQPGTIIEHPHTLAHGKIYLANMEKSHLNEYLKSKLVPYTEYTILKAKQIRDELITIRKRNWAKDINEHRYGISRFSAGIFNKNNSLIGVIGIAGSTKLLFSKQENSIGKLILESAKIVQRNLYQLPG